MSRSSLQQIVNRGANYHSLPSGVDRKASNLNSVTTGDVLHKGCLANDLDKFLASVSILVEIADVTRRHCFLQGDVDGVLMEPILEYFS